MPDRNRYEVLILTIFKNHYREGSAEFEFDRSEIETVARDLGIRLPKNLGDLIYSFRYRRDLPKEIVATEKAGKEWIIAPAGRSKYRFRLSKLVRAVPNESLDAIKVPDSTPEIVSAWALSDEQAACEGSLQPADRRLSRHSRLLVAESSAHRGAGYGPD